MNWCIFCTEVSKLFRKFLTSSTAIKKCICAKYRVMICDENCELCIFSNFLKIPVMHSRWNMPKSKKNNREAKWAKI